MPMETTADYIRPSASSFNETTKSQMDPSKALAMTLLRTVVPVIVLMGTVGNALSFCVLVRRRMRSTPMYFYLTLLAVADTFVLYVSAFKVWIRALTQFEVLHVSNVGCKLFMFILLCSFYMSAWLVVLVTLDRFLVVWFPFRGYLFMRIRRARLTAAVLAVVVAVYNIHVFWTMSLHRFGSAPTCDADEDNFFMTHIFEYLKLISYCVVPFVVVVALNVGILVRINRVYTNYSTSRDCGVREAAAVYRHQTPMVVLGPPTPSHGNVDNEADGVVWPPRQHLAFSQANSASPTSGQSHVHAQKLRQRRLTRMLLFISFAWLALTAPFTLHSFFPGPSSHSSDDSSSSLPSSSSSTVNFLKPTSFVTSPALNQRMKPEDSIVDRLYNQDSSAIFHSRYTSLLDSNQPRNTTKGSFLAEERASLTSPMFVTTSSPSTGIDPSHYLLVKTICFLLMYINHAVNFYLYCLSGRRFRKELASMLSCGRVMLLCSGCDDSPTATADAGAVARDIGRVHVDVPRQRPLRVPLNHDQSSSTSSRSRTRSADMMMNLNRVRNDERYSGAIATVSQSTVVLLA